MDPHIGRRALLAATAAATVAPVAAQTADPRTGFAALRLGANLERWFPIAAGGHARRLGRGWWEGLRGAGFDHVRMFMPRDAGGGEDVLRLYLTSVEDAVAAGLPVLFAFNDAYGSTEPWDEPTLRLVAARARLFGRATDPARVVLAPLNEPAFPNAADWTPVRDRLLALLRAEAPRHVLMWGGHEWCSWRSLLQQPPAPDPLTIAEVHDYEGGDAAWIRDRFAQVAEWGRRHRTPVMVTELGGRMGHQADEAAWAEDLRRSLPELRRLRLPAALWAVTHGGDWRLQQGPGPALRPLLAAAIRA